MTRKRFISRNQHTLINCFLLFVLLYLFYLISTGASGATEDLFAHDEEGYRPTLAMVAPSMIKPLPDDYEPKISLSIGVYSYKSTFRDTIFSIDLDRYDLIISDKVIVDKTGDVRIENRFRRIEGYRYTDNDSKVDVVINFHIVAHEDTIEEIVYFGEFEGYVFSGRSRDSFEDLLRQLFIDEVKRGNRNEK